MREDAYYSEIKHRSKIFPEVIYWKLGCDIEKKIIIIIEYRVEPRGIVLQSWSRKLNLCIPCAFRNWEFITWMWKSVKSQTVRETRGTIIISTL